MTHLLSICAPEKGSVPTARRHRVDLFGIRPLFDDGSRNAFSMSCDYVPELDDDGHPLPRVFGGKIATCRRLAEHALDQLVSLLPAMSGAWSHAMALLSGPLPGSTTDFRAHLRARYLALSLALLDRPGRTYGTDAETVSGDAGTMRDLGEVFGAGLTAREVGYLINREWARTAEDILFRRSKLGLHMAGPSITHLDSYVQQRAARGATIRHGC